MTIEKLARFIVDDYYDGAPDEMYTNAVEREVKKMRAYLAASDMDFPYVKVEVEEY